MCGRFAAGHLTQAQMLAIMENFLYGSPLSENLPPPASQTGFNIKPTQDVWAGYLHEGHLQCEKARWWLVPTWHKGDIKDWKATTFNAKIETANSKPTFRTAWQTGRCLIPALGYYEWTGAKGSKQPWFVTLQSNQPYVFFAGLMTHLADDLRTCTILTRPAAPEISKLHPRMPVMLSQHDADAWLHANDSDEHIIETYGTQWLGRIRYHTVPRFGQNDDGPELIEADGFAI